jgi:hypothetical protein
MDRRSHMVPAKVPSVPGLSKTGPSGPLEERKVLQQATPIRNNGAAILSSATLTP